LIRLTFTIKTRNSAPRKRQKFIFPFPGLKTRKRKFYPYYHTQRRINLISPPDKDEIFGRRE